MKRYLIKFANEIHISPCEITASSPKEALTKLLANYNYIGNIQVLNNIQGANVIVELVGSKRSINYYKVSAYKKEEKHMSRGMRNSSAHILTENEINEVKRAIEQIGADIRIFRFNHPQHQHTCYSPDDDLIYIGGDVLPDMKYASNHPRDLMSVRAVVAHEYYGHRPRRQQYLDEFNKRIKPMPRWLDEYKADYDAAKYAKGLDDLDRYQLIQSAILRKEEANQISETDDFMKEVLYGYNSSERRFIQRGKRISL